MPKLVAPLLCSETTIDWDKVRFFAVDERMVPIEDSESNTGAYLRLLPEKFHKSFLPYGPIDDREWNEIYDLRITSYFLPNCCYLLF